MFIITCNLHDEKTRLVPMSVTNNATILEAILLTNKQRFGQMVAMFCEMDIYHQSVRWRETVRFQKLFLAPCRATRPIPTTVHLDSRRTVEVDL